MGSVVVQQQVVRAFVDAATSFGAAEIAVEDVSITQYAELPSTARMMIDSSGDGRQLLQSGVVIGLWVATYNSDDNSTITALVSGIGNASNVEVASAVFVMVASLRSADAVVFADASIVAGAVQGIDAPLLNDALPTTSVNSSDVVRNGGVIAAFVIVALLVLLCVAYVTRQACKEKRSHVSSVPSKRQTGVNWKGTESSFDPAAAVAAPASQPGSSNDPKLLSPKPVETVRKQFGFAPVIPAGVAGQSIGSRAALAMEAGAPIAGGSLEQPLPEIASSASSKRRKAKAARRQARYNNSVALGAGATADLRPSAAAASSASSSAASGIMRAMGAGSDLSASTSGASIACLDSVHTPAIAGGPADQAAKRDRRQRKGRKGRPSIPILPGSNATADSLQDGHVSAADARISTISVAGDMPPLPGTVSRAARTGAAAAEDGHGHGGTAQSPASVPR